MVTVSANAASLLREIQTTQEEGGEKVLRLVNRSGQFELTFDAVRDDDHVFQSEGKDVLLVAPEGAEGLAAATIDSQDTPEGPRLTLSTQAQ